MSPADRRAQAYAIDAGDLTAPLSSKGADGAHALMEPNPAFFDQARPADIQALAIRAHCDGAQCEFSDPTADKIFAQLDWNALATLVH